MVKLIYILFFIFIGLLFMPIQEAYACKQEHNTSTKEQKHLTKKVKSLTKYTAKHCKKDSCPQGVCAKHGKNCKGNCGDVSCQCSTTSCTVFILPTFSYLIPCRVLMAEKVKFPTTKAFCFDGFLSVWLPPKIS